MQHGSLINMIAGNSTDTVEPEIEMGATLIMWSDRHAGTIIGVSKTGHRIEWQRDKATRTDGLGMTDAQQYSYERNRHAAVETFTRRKDGSYRIRGGTSRLVLNVRNEYHDYSF